MAITFRLKVKNPVTRNPQQNINWGDGFGEAESAPDAMPVGDQFVTFTVGTNPGEFLLVHPASNGPGWTSSLKSPRIVPADGITYVWDMQANTVQPEGAGGFNFPADLLKPPYIYLIGGLIAAKVLRLI